MVLSVGAAKELLLSTSPSEEKAVESLARALGAETILAMMQIVDQALDRMRVSTYRRTLAELAVVQMCSLESLQDIHQVIRQLASGTIKPGAALGGQAAPAAVRTAAGGAPVNPTATSGRDRSAAEVPTEPPRTYEVAPTARTAKKNAVEPASEVESIPLPATSEGNGGLLTAENAREVWHQAIVEIGDMAAAAAQQCREIAILAPNHLVVRFPARYKMSKALCERPEQTQRIEAALARLAGHRVRVEFAVDDDLASGQGAVATARRTTSPRERLLQAASNPLVQRTCELFGGTPLRVEEAER
jgi:DNA polymerase III gamma/tau subunit